MDFAGSAFSATLLSSCMPFLNALIPCATSPIRSEILPRPKSSRTTPITTIQCQMLSEPILQSSKHKGPAGEHAAVLAGEIGVEPRLADRRVGVVEFLGLGEMGDVARVDHEGGLLRRRADLGDRLVEG